MPQKISPWDILTSSGKYPERERSNECTTEIRINAADLAERVSRLLDKLGITTTITSGFRTTTANKGASGAKRSAHMSGQACDLADPKGEIGKKITVALLVECDLYMEDLSYTKEWVHLQTRPTKNRIFKP